VATERVFHTPQILNTNSLLTYSGKAERMANKQIVSFSLSEDAISILDKTAKALGRSRSDFLEWIITEGFKWTPAIQEKIEAINKLQKKIEGTTECVGNSN
jgi:hypothetical protein